MEYCTSLIPALERLRQGEHEVSQSYILRVLQVPNPKQNNKEERWEREREGKGNQGLEAQKEGEKEKGKHNPNSGCASPLMENNGLYQAKEAHS